MPTVSEPARATARDDVEISTMRRITALLRQIPPLTASAEVRAAWFERKADVFDAIATRDAHRAEEARRLAQNARLRAEQIRRGCCA